jgi:hypothetical protein
MMLLMGGLLVRIRSGFDGEDSNLTRYVGNSPTNGTDPSGLQILMKPVRLPSINPFPQRPGYKPEIFPLGDYDYNELLRQNKPIPEAPAPRVKPLNPNLQPINIRLEPLQYYRQEPDYSDDQLEVFERRRAKVTQYRDRLAVDQDSAVEPNCRDNKLKCKTTETFGHLGGSKKGSKFATEATGSMNDFLIFAQDGAFAFFDGLVQKKSELRGLYGVTTTRHVVEAKAWNYGQYKKDVKVKSLAKLQLSVYYDLAIATKCKYTYSFATSSLTLTSAFNDLGTGVNAYHVPFEYNGKYDK